MPTQRNASSDASPVVPAQAAEISFPDTRAEAVRRLKSAQTVVRRLKGSIEQLTKQLADAELDADQCADDLSEWDDDQLQGRAEAHWDDQETQGYQ